MVWTRPEKGTPQGGVVSPLLANIYLHWFDKVFNGRNGPGQWANAKLVRYADDFVILARYQGEEMKAFVEEKIENWMGLELNREKTTIVELTAPKARLDFLGYSYRLDRDMRGTGGFYLNMFPSGKALERERAAIRDLTGREKNYVAVRTLIGQVNKQLTGWQNYFNQGYPGKAYSKINWYVRFRLVRHLKRRSQRPYKKPKDKTWFRHLEELGLKLLVTDGARN